MRQLLIIAAMLLPLAAHGQLYCASDDCDDHHHHHHHGKRLNRERAWIVPVVAVAVAAGVVCWYECKRDEPEPKKADPDPLQVAPSGKSQTFTVRPAK